MLCETMREKMIFQAGVQSCQAHIKMLEDRSRSRMAALLEIHRFYKKYGKFVQAQAIESAIKKVRKVV